MDREVYFCVYCRQCKYEKVPESEDPCFLCLDTPVNEDTHRPINFSPSNKKNSDIRQCTKYAKVLERGKRCPFRTD